MDTIISIGITDKQFNCDHTLYPITIPHCFRISGAEYDIAPSVEYIHLIFKNRNIGFKNRLICLILTASLRRKKIGHGRSEEHTSELQSRGQLVCRLLLEKK